MSHPRRKGVDRDDLQPAPDGQRVTGPEGIGMSADESALQRAYYRETSSSYESQHCGASGEHEVALAVLSGFIDLFRVRSVLDVGSGTGRALRFLKPRHPGVQFVGIEPVDELRAIGLLSHPII